MIALQRLFTSRFVFLALFYLLALVTISYAVLKSDFFILVISASWVLWGGTAGIRIARPDIYRR